MICGSSPEVESKIFQESEKHTACEEWCTPLPVVSSSPKNWINMWRRRKVNKLWGEWGGEVKSKENEGEKFKKVRIKSRRQRVRRWGHSCAWRPPWWLGWWPSSTSSSTPPRSPCSTGSSIPKALNLQLQVMCSCPWFFTNLSLSRLGWGELHQFRQGDQLAELCCLRCRLSQC